MRLIKTFLMATSSLTMLLGSTVTFAGSSDCAVISTKSVPHHRDKEPLVLTAHNGKHLFGISKKMVIPTQRTRGATIEPFGNVEKSKATRDYVKMALSPGIHHFTAYVDRKRSQAAGTEFTFAINVEAGKFYKLIGQRVYPKVSNPRKQYEPVILTSKSNDCEQSDFKEVYQALAGNASAKTGAEPTTFAVNMNN